jgi:DHA1 family multidrug resistance protein-like MFS transporter
VSHLQLEYSGLDGKKILLSLWFILTDGVPIRTGFTPNVHWAVPAASGIFTGFGLLSIFLQVLNYLVDAYLVFAASAIAGNTFLRSLCGAGFPLFARQMFDGMGIQWASTLLGSVAVVLIPIPFVFYWYGARIREKSAYAPH